MMLLPRPPQGPESWSRPLCKTGWVEIHPGVPSQPGMGVVGRFTGMLQAGTTCPALGPCCVRALCSVVSHSLQPPGLEPARLPCP